MQRSIHSIIERWRSEGLRIAEPCTTAQIKEFELRHSIRLPADFKAYLLSVNGMAPDCRSDVDGRGFSFWPLQRICSAFDDLKCAGMSPLDHFRAYFIFADYLQWSWVYAIQLGSKESAIGKIVRVDTPERLLDVSNSFTEFLELYLADSDRLYDPEESMKRLRRRDP